MLVVRDELVQRCFGTPRVFAADAFQLDDDSQRFTIQDYLQVEPGGFPAIPIVPLLLR